jgi:hypothetical protein
MFQEPDLVLKENKKKIPTSGLMDIKYLLFKEVVPAALLWERELVAIVQEAGWISRPVWTGEENLTPRGIQFLDFSA